MHRLWRINNRQGFSGMKWATGRNWRQKKQKASKISKFLAFSSVGYEELGNLPIKMMVKQRVLALRSLFDE